MCPCSPSNLNTRWVTTPNGEGSALTSRRSVATRMPESEKAPDVEKLPERRSERLFSADEEGLSLGRSGDSREEE